MPFLRGDLGQDLKAASIELIGTTTFLLFFLGSVQTANYAAQIGGTDTRTLDHNVYIAASAGVSLLASAWVFYRTTGAVFNPAVSLALRLIGEITTVRCILYILAQILGGIIASALVLGITPGPVLFNNRLGEGATPAQGVFIELFGTAFLVISVLMLAAEKSKITPFAPIGISMTLFADHLYSVAWTGSGFNPARSFGPDVVAGSFAHEHWIYWIGPLGGSLLAVVFYAWLKHTRYWEITPNATATNPQKSPDAPFRKNDLESGPAP